MKIKYKHTNIIARDWQALAAFYEKVFGCVPIPPERHLEGAWLDRGTGVPGARFSGVHLRLPGHGENGPTLEIYQYGKNEPKPCPAANREGFAHIAFEVEDVEQATAAVLRHGGAKSEKCPRLLLRVLVFSPSYTWPIPRVTSSSFRPGSRSSASTRLGRPRWPLARIMHEPPAATADLAVLPGVLGSRTLRRTDKVRLRSEPLWLPGGTTISTISPRRLLHNAG